MPLVRPRFLYCKRQIVQRKLFPLPRISGEIFRKLWAPCDHPLSGGALGSCYHSAHRHREYLQMTRDGHEGIACALGRSGYDADGPAPRRPLIRGEGDRTGVRRG